MSSRLVVSHILLVTSFFLAAVAIGCGGSAASPASDAALTETSHPSPDASRMDGAPPDASRAEATPGDATQEASSPLDADMPFDSAGFTPIDGGNAVIPPSTAGTWTWVPFPEAKCRDGSTTGIGINFATASKNLVVFLEGGGACFNGLTCAGNPASFGAADLPVRFPATDGGIPLVGNGILDRTNLANPVKDWNFVYVPYCTGDLHAGNNPAGTIPGLSPQMFVGYSDVDLYLQRLVPTFGTATQVLLTGISGGGFGAAANYIHVQRAFGSVPVSLLDDSGPFMEDPYLATCMQDNVRSLWGLDSTLGADCNGHCNNPPRFFIDLARYAASLHPTVPLGLVEDTDDGTITEFFGFGAMNCTSLVPLSAATFTAGLDDIRTQMASSANFGSFIFTGTQHTTIDSSAFYTRVTTNAEGGTLPLTSWVSSLVGGTITNVGP